MPGVDSVPGDPVFVLVHGLASNARTWDGVAAALAARGRRSYAVDLRGHGRSSRPDAGYDVSSVAADLDRLIARLSDAPVVLAGQSWGGNVVMEAAARFPQRIGAVCGVDGGAIRLAAVFPQWERCAEELAPPPIAGMAGDVFERHIRSAHPDWPESGIVGTLANVEWRADGTVAPWLTRTRHMLVLRGLWEHDPRAAYPHIRVPALLIAVRDADSGRRTSHHAGTWERLRERALADAIETLPDGELVWFDGADHDVHAQHPERVAELLLGLSDRMMAAARGRRSEQAEA